MIETYIMALKDHALSNEFNLSEADMEIHNRSYKIFTHTIMSVKSMKNVIDI